MKASQTLKNTTCFALEFQLHFFNNDGFPSKEHCDNWRILSLFQDHSCGLRYILSAFADNLLG